MDSATPSVLIVARDAEEGTTLKDTLQPFGLGVRVAMDGPSALDMFYTDPPQCLVLEHNLTVDNGRSLLQEVKSDNVYGHLPVILMVNGAERDNGFDWSTVPADDYVVRPFPASELASRVRICLARASRDVNANPLTGLPGNLTITREAERRLASGLPFCMAYLDVDHFKAFNDRYGFSRGDEVLRMTARVIVNAIRSLGSDDSYVGHVGGDDFVFMTGSTTATAVCKRITEDFDRIVPNFYDEEDRTRGNIQSVDRQGNPQVFPLMSISIAVVDTQTAQLIHIAELFGRIAEVKSFAKRLPGSNYIIDRRK